MATVALLALPGMASGAEPAAKPAYGAASPQALVERLNRAIVSKDFAELVNCLDADSRVEASAGVLALTVMMVTMPDVAGPPDDISPEIAAALTPEQKAMNDKERLKARQREQAKVRARLAAVLKRHGLPDFTAPGMDLPQAAERKRQLAGVDHGALVRDLLGFVGAPGDGPVDLPLTEPVRNLTVSGVEATATAGKEALALVRRSGRWYLAAKDMMGKPE
jgi:hypothetical protein